MCVTLCVDFYRIYYSSILDSGLNIIVCTPTHTRPPEGGGRVGKLSAVRPVDLLFYSSSKQ